MKREDRKFTNISPIVSEAFLKGKWVEFHGCGSGDLTRVRKWYKAYTYIGSGFVTRHNGKKHVNSKWFHFFRLKK